MGTLIFLITSILLYSQKLSIDLAGIRQIQHESNGLNIAGFYHFNEKLSGGIEVNRFFPVHHVINDEENSLSAWDLELNFHYYIPLASHFQLYPISGISHTSERETSVLSASSHYDRFWSFNTGAGLLWQWKKWSPHVEYNFTWGHLNQQFLLAGISYEIEW